MIGSAMEGDPAQKSRNGKRRPAVLGSLILISGILIGIAGTLIFQRWMWWRPMFPPPTPEMVAERMKQDLRLPAGQAAAFDQAVIPHLRAIGAIQREIAPRIDEEFGLMKNEVSAILDEAQLKSWLERTEHAQKMFREAHPVPGGPPFPPPPPSPGM